MTDEELTREFVKRCGETTFPVLVEHLTTEEYFRKYPHHNGIFENGLTAIMTEETAEGEILDPDPGVDIFRNILLKDSPYFQQMEKYLSV